MNGFHVERMSENEGDAFSRTEVGEPVPSEDALDRDDELLPERGDGIQEDVGIGGEVSMKECFSFLVENA